MSRIGKLPVAIPEKVKVSVDGQNVSIEGPKGSLKKSFDHSVKIELVENEVRVSPVDDSRHSRAMYGTVRSIINGMVVGVVDGYTKKLQIKGVGFRAVLKGNILDLALGYSHPCELEIPEGIKVTVAENTKITVEGADKQVVGQVTAEIYQFFPAEPYKGKGVHIEGQYVRRKEGKKSA
ncbi:MAG: 50S ribosomal protein L6 [Coraliomargaritaceae bacterium]|jgi:large subunit ribosomal protein L6|tara:strand:- start:407 stop:943 length:537 start_codon:yes stop_codon:yes gene_type:complete